MVTDGYPSAMQLNHEDLQKKANELSDALREKTRKHSQMQELYNRLKRRTLYSQVQNAASDAANQSLQTVHGADHRLDSVSSHFSNRQPVQGPTEPRARHANPIFVGEHSPHQQAPSTRAFGGASEAATNAIRQFIRPTTERNTLTNHLNG